MVFSREQEVAQLKAVNHKQQAELTNIVNLITNTNEINSNQTEIVEQFLQLKTLVQEMKINNGSIDSKG
ncbi:hypothetical protein VB713_22035 [Anabaena cylindrica UHCC 0172]|uniref:hypothetical protein n=1 Tax=Anabaena cylindrica TaxID=1165 RepID=UPI002B1F3D46|nr:hypothetical protein [Anabaena cylindrica]MEA5553622.1 hypothetical protein [Anabaena cylindrica UHCC 0172]